MPIGKVTGKRRETITEERISVIGKNAESKSYRGIPELTCVSRSRAAGIVMELSEIIRQHQATVRGGR
jgi:hypothetical protein